MDCLIIWEPQPPRTVRSCPSHLNIHNFITTSQSVLSLTLCVHYLQKEEDELCQYEVTAVHSPSRVRKAESNGQMRMEW
jgi:hypothetical protein